VPSMITTELGAMRCGWCLCEVGGEFGAVAAYPVEGVADGSGPPRCHVAGSSRGTVDGLGLDAPPAPVFPSQDRLQQAAAVWQAVGVAAQPHPPACRGRVDHARAEVKVLPADMGDVVDPLARRGDVPVDERRPRSSVRRNLGAPPQLCRSNHPSSACTNSGSSGGDRRTVFPARTTGVTNPPGSRCSPTNPACHQAAGNHHADPASSRCRLSHGHGHDPSDSPRPAEPHAGSDLPHKITRIGAAERE
jgi:hypothetical protein